MNVFDKREQTSNIDLPSAEKVRASEDSWKKDIADEVLTFVVFAIESAAEKLGVSSVEIFNRMQRIGLIQSILVEGYETLHTQSKEYIADAVIEALHNWEAYYAQKGGQA